MSEQSPSQETDPATLPEPGQAADQPADHAEPQGAIVALPGRYYRNARYIMALLFLSYGVWCVRDGFFLWPQQNFEAIAKGYEPPHKGIDIPLNQGLGVALPLFAFTVVGFMRYRSRGQYRLEDNILHVPGHPPVPFDAVRDLDDKLWDRKGICFVQYKLPNMTEEAEIKLDDFVYQQVPTDQIHDAIRAYLDARDEPPVD